MNRRRSLDTPEKVYQRLQQFWRMHIAAEDPDWHTLRVIHDALCRQETQLRKTAPDQCVSNLHERVQDARRFDMDLPLPKWAAEEIAAFDRWAAENLEQNL